MARGRSIRWAGALAPVLAAALALPAWPRGAARASSQAIGITKIVPMLAGPTGIGYGHGVVWVTRDNGTVARVDPRSGRIVGMTHVGRFPVRVAVGSRWAWVSNSEGDSVSQIDVATGRRRRTIPVCDQPAGIALAADSVWVVCTLDTRLYRIDQATGRIIAAIPIGLPPDDPPAIAAGPTGLWATRFDSVVQISPLHNAVAASVRVRGPSDVTVGPHDVWAASIRHRRVSRIDPRSNLVDRSFQLGHGPSGVALALHRLWVLDNTDSTVTELDERTGRRLARVTVGAYSYDIAAGDGAVWAQSYGDRALYEVQPVLAGST